MSKHFDSKKELMQAMNSKRNLDKFVSGSYRAYMILGLTALHDEFGFGSARLERYIDKMNDVLDSYNKGYVNVEDLRECLLKETGIDVEHCNDIKANNATKMQ